jgi:phosphoribosylamine--glycine ligase
VRILVIGGGGREHALVWKLAQSPLVEKIYCAPGNPGIAQLAACVDIPPTGAAHGRSPAANLRALRHFAHEARIDLTVVGPEAPLVNGIVDEFQAHGFFIFGPSKQAAMLEGSKAFAKELMRKYRIPTADAQIFDDYQKARDYVEKVDIPVVVKADGLAAGKGAIVARHRDTALEAVHRMMQDREFGDAGNRVIVEEFMEGEEVSVLCVTDGMNLCILPAAQDHKAVFDNDEGPNTGGMGAYAPVPFVNAELLERIRRQILQPVVAAMALENRAYRGVLYAGLMITKDGPKVVEFNCRFGDPEAQVVVPLIASDLAEAMWRVAQGDLSGYELKILPRWALTVVMASGGYPGKFEKGKTINGFDQILENDVLIFHAGTRPGPRGNVVTNSGRVLAITGVGNDFHSAREKAYQAAGKIQFDGVHYRKDIGAKALRYLMT